jgi:hypothetical protein
VVGNAGGLMLKSEGFIIPRPGCPPNWRTETPPRKSSDKLEKTYRLLFNSSSIRLDIRCVIACSLTP